MIQVLEYIASNYIWFLGGAIVILLAIIGYVADKTNFGQGKNEGTEEKNIDLDRLNSIGIDQLYTENAERQLEQDQEIELKQQENQSQMNNEQMLTDQIINSEMNSMNSQPSEQNSNILDIASGMNLVENSKNDIQNKQIDIDLSSFISSTSTLNKKVIDEIKSDVGSEINTDSVLSEESFNDFNKEFDMILPKKEIIDSDLLTDIEDLNFDKTQKLDFSDISNFSNIELPNIKRVNKEEHDIWKF